MKADSLARRLRVAPPQPIVRRMVLTQPDIILFEAIDRHGPLPIHYLYEFTRHLRRDYTHLQHRLTEFYNGDAHGPYLTRPPQQFASYEARYQHLVYDLAPRAKFALAERGRASRHSPRRTDPFVHQLMGACVAASIELGAPGKGLGYIPREEILSRSTCRGRDAPNPMAIPIPGGRSLIPDDLFGLRYPLPDGQTGYRFFAVEIDRATESIERRNFRQTAFGTKVRAYGELLRSRVFKNWWGVPNLSVLAVTTNATHGANMIRLVEKEGGGEVARKFAVAIEPSFGASWRMPNELLSHLVTGLWGTATGGKNIHVPWLRPS